jgi:peptidoglycan hydrolase CwlO-like protein
MPFFMSIAIAIFFHEFMITYASVAAGVAMPAAWVIFFLSLYILENIKPIKLLNSATKLLAEKRKENNQKILELEKEIDNTHNEIQELKHQINELKNQLNIIQNKPIEHTMEAELNFFKKTQK